MPKAFSEGEIVFLLEKLVEFIEFAATHELAEVEEKFGISGSDTFSRVQRQIRNSFSPSQPATDFRVSARNAFQAATHAWAANLLDKSDPLSFRVSEVVAAIKKNSIKALADACTMIIKEYGYHLLDQALTNSERPKLVESAKKSYQRRLKKFLRGREGRLPWQSDVLRSTVRLLEKELIG